MSHYRNLPLYLFCLFINAGAYFSHSCGQQGYFAIAEDHIEECSYSEIPTRNITSGNDFSLEINYSFNGYSISEIQIEEETYQVLRMEGFGLSLHTGNPSLPVRTEKIALPPGTEPSITLIKSEFIEVDGYNIFPAQ